MAEPVIVPVQLEVTDVDTSNINFDDASKQISKSLATVKKSIQDAFSGIDASAINKPVEKAMAAVEKTVQSAESAYLQYRETMLKAGKSTEEYKADVAAANAAIRDQEQLIHELSKLGPAASSHLAQAQKELDALIEARKNIDPLNYVDKAEPIQLEKVANAYKKVLSAQEDVTKKSEEFNQTAKDNRTTDEYEAMIKEAESYKQKLAELNDKSKYMEKYGATDKQWEKARNDADWYSSKLDEVIKKLRESVKTGAALRFGDGPKADLSRQINSLAMSGGNQSGAVKARAMKNESPFTEDYQKALNELDKLEKKVEAIREKSAKMVELGASQKQFQSIAYDAEQLDVKVDEVKNHLMNMVNEGGAFKFGTGDADAEIQKIRDKSDGLQSSLTGVANTANKAQGGLKALGVTHPKLAAILTTAGKVGAVMGKIASGAAKAGKAIISGFKNAFTAIGKVTSAIGRVVTGIAGAAKKMLSFGKTGSKTSGDLNSRFKKLSKNILMWGFGFRTAYYAIKRLRNIFIESFKVMGDAFDEVGTPMKTMMESFNRLKASLATAFQPIVSVVMPILTRFMNYLSGVLEGIGKFMASLTGQGRIYKAVAKNINSVADAAGNANDKLGAYDKLEVISQDSNNTGVEYEAQELEAGDAASSFADMVKKAWESADFTSVGVFVTDKLLGILDLVEQNMIPKVTEFVNHIMESVNTFFDGFDATAIGAKIGSIVNTVFEGIDWSQVGMFFANLFSEVWQFFDGLVNNIDWALLGESLATGIESLFSTLDFDAWVGMISGLINGVTEAFLYLITNVDWVSVATELGTAVSNLFTSIDAEQIGTAVNTVFESALTFVESFFNTDGAESMTTFFTDLIDSIDWDGIVMNIVEAIQTVLESVGTALSESDNPLLAGFGGVILALSEAIEILKPAIEDIIEAISPIIQSILPIISQVLPPIAEIIATAVQMVMPVLVKLFEAFMPIIARLAEVVLPIVLDLIQSLQPIFDAIVTTVLPVIVHLLGVLMPLIESVLNLLGNILAPILSALGPVIEIIFTAIDVIITILEPVISIIGTLCNVLGAILRPILDALTPILSSISSVFQLLSPIINLLMTPLSRLADVFEFVGGILTGILNPALQLVKGLIDAVCNVVNILASAFRTAFNGVKNVVDSAWNKIKNPLNSMLAGIESIANGFIRMINTMIRGINKVGFNIPDWDIFGDMAGKRFGFNITELREISIPRLAQGAVIPPNKEFLAMLGDQKHGTNIEAPLDTIKQALAEVLAEAGGAGNREPIILQVNGRTLAKVVWDEQEKHYKQTGRYSMA